MRPIQSRTLTLILVLTAVNLLLLFFNILSVKLDGSATPQDRINLQALGLAVAGTFLLLGLLVMELVRRLSRSRRQAESEQARLHDAVDSLSVAFALFSSSGELLICNRRWRQLYPWADPRQMDWDRFNRQLGSHVVNRDRVDSENPNAESCIDQMDTGHIIKVSNCRTREGGIASVRTDITRAQDTEKKLRTLGRAMEQSPVSVMITDTRGIIEYVNPKFSQVSGYSRKEALGQSAGILKSGRVPAQVYEDLWSTLEKGDEWHGQLLNRRKDGSLFWESASISALRDENGSLLSYIAVKEDITGQKAAEEQLRMAETVFRTSNEAIMITDREGRIKTTNPAFTRITGYTLEEVRGRNPNILNSGRHDEHFYQTMWQELAARGTWSGEIWNRRKDGSIYPEWLSISVVHDQAGEISEYVAVFTDITQRKNDEARIMHQAYYDELTQLPNRTLLSDRLNLAIATADRDHQAIALLFIDLDRFKYVNDSMGHEYGDDLLRQVAQRFNNCVRDTDTVARFGGDEFVVLLHNIKSEADAAYVAGKLIDRLSEPFLLAGREIIIGASIGIAMHPGDADTADMLIRNADLAMYKAKQSGRNRIHFFTSTMQDHANQRMSLEQDLRQALDRNQFEVFYQPVVNGLSGRVAGVEALLRWHHPDRGTVPPEQFVPLAEETGLIGPIGEWVLETACAQLRTWEDNGIHLHLSVNISERQRELGLHIGIIKRILERHRLPPSRLVLEITEGLLLQDSEETINWLNGFKQSGVRLAIDDFGTGYSSLSYLKRFPVDTLKIDKEFIRDLETDHYADSLVGAIISMATSLELNMVAEGVETLAQRTSLARRGCQFMQGYLFCRPLAACELTAWLEQYQPRSLTAEAEALQPELS